MFRGIIINESTKHFRGGDILKHRFFACYYSNSPKVDIILRIGFENYEVMSESAKKAFKNKEIDFPFYINTKVTYNYQYLVGDLLLHENFFFYFSELFEAVSNKILFSQQLYFTKQDCTNYVLRNSFTKNYFEIFASNRLLNLYRKVAKSIDVSTQSLKIEHLNIDDNKSDFIFYYESDNIRDIVFSTVHFALEQGYKFIKCKHCGKWFWAKSLKETYCNRNTTYPGYERYTCKDAVKKIKDRLEKKRISEYERLRLKAKEYGSFSKHFRVWNDFNNTCDEYKKRLKYNSSIALLQEYQSYLFDSENVRKKYERIK